MSVDFPNIPTDGQTYSFGNRTWVWSNNNGGFWQSTSTTTYSGYTGSQGDVGYTGSMGTGYVGSQGNNGYDGSQGDIGYTGSEGSPYLFNFFSNIFTGNGSNTEFTIFNGGNTTQNSAIVIINGVTQIPTTDYYTGAYNIVGSNNIITFTSPPVNGSTIEVKSMYGGLIGVAGYQGSVGYTGSVGYLGSVGYQGSAGATGPQGPSGGQDGYTGSAGTFGPQTITVAMSDEATALTVGNGKLTIRAPYAFYLNGTPRASLVAQGASVTTVDVKVNGSSIFGTNKLTIDASEKTSVTAAVSPSFTPNSLLVADDSEIRFDILTAGTGATGLKVTLYVQKN